MLADGGAAQEAGARDKGGAYLSAPWRQHAGAGRALRSLPGAGKCVVYSAYILTREYSCNNAVVFVCRPRTWCSMRMCSCRPSAST